MATETAERLWTVEDLLALPDDGFQYELSRGRLIQMAPASWRPSAIASRAERYISAYVIDHELGHCTSADGGYQLGDSPDTLRAPDIGFVRADRFTPDSLPHRFFIGPPDLAVEVKSPTDRMADALLKIGEYLDAGVRLVWFLNPERRIALVFRLDGTVTLLREHDELDGEDVLPGFRLALDRLWL